MGFGTQIKIEDIDKTKFSYRIGEVSTKTPWLRPEYQRIVYFLQSAQAKPILKKYKIHIIGSCLWDMSSTWDVDLLMCPLNGFMPSSLEDFLQIEKDMYTLYHTAFNDWKLLLDIAFRTEDHKLPKKELIESYNIDKNYIDEYTYPTDIPYTYKIGYVKKIIGNEISETVLYDNEKFPNNKRVTGFHLTRVMTAPSFPNKVIKKIMEAKDPLFILSSMPIEQFITLGPEGFAKFRNI